jgi:hypothetical protein
MRATCLACLTFLGLIIVIILCCMRLDFSRRSYQDYGRDETPSSSVYHHFEEHGSYPSSKLQGITSQNPIIFIFCHSLSSAFCFPYTINRIPQLDDRKPRLCGSYSCFVFERPNTIHGARRPRVLYAFFHGFPLPLQGNTGIVP